MKSHPAGSPVDSFKSGCVAIIGRPNVGKSTLINRLLGTAVSIVTPKAQTTRDRVLGILTEPEKGQLVFIDTPGIHRAKEGGLNQVMVREAQDALEGPDLVWYLLDPSSAPEHEKGVLELLKGVQAPIYLILNKSDAKYFDSERNDQFLERLRAEGESLGLKFEKTFQISAKRGDCVEELVNASWEKIPVGEMLYPDPDQISDRPIRFFVAEKIREQLLMCLGEEVPYCCAVEIVNFNENSKPVRIEAVIHVERDSQKGIVIGKGGSKIREIGQNARAQIEEFLGTPIFLGLQAHVLKDWSRDARSLERLGYHLPKPSDQRRRA